MTGGVRQSGLVANRTITNGSNRISAANTSNEVDSVKNVLACFFAFPEHTRWSAQLRMVDCSRVFYVFPFHVHSTSSAHSLLRLGVAHCASLRSLRTMMSSLNSSHLGEAGRLLRECPCGNAKTSTRYKPKVQLSHVARFAELFEPPWITSIRRERHGVIHPSGGVIRMLQARNQGRRTVTTDVPSLNATSSMSEG